MKNRKIFDVSKPERSTMIFNGNRKITLSIQIKTIAYKKQLEPRESGELYKFKR